MPLRVQRIDAGAAGELVDEVTEFVAQHPHATGYSSPLWVHAFASSMNMEAGYVVVREGTSMLGLLPFVSRPLIAWIPSARIQPRKCESLSHDCYAGPLVRPGLKDGLTTEVARSLIGSLRTLRTPLVRVLMPAWRADDRMIAVLRSCGFAEAFAYDIAVKDLRGLDQSGLERSYHQSHRRAVAAAQNRGASVRLATGSSDFLEFAGLLNETMGRVGYDVKFPLELIVDGGSTLVARGMGRLYLAELDGRIVAGMFTITSPRNACYWLGATTGDRQALNARPMHAVFHAAFRNAVTDGCEFFELGGLPTVGLRDFKTRWGTLTVRQPTFEWSPVGILHLARRAGARVRDVLREHRQHSGRLAQGSSANGTAQ